MTARTLHAATLLLFLLAGTARAGFDALLYETGEDTVRALRARDVTGDGRLDLLAFTDGPRGTAVHVFDLKAPAGAASRAMVTIRPEELGLREVYYVFTARAVRDRPPQIVFADRRRGVVAISLRSKDDDFVPGEQVVLAAAPNLPYFPDPRHTTLLDAAVDLDGDGVEELVLPGRDGYRLEKPPGSPPRELSIPPAQKLSWAPHRLLQFSWTLPRLTAADYDGDGRTDFLAGREGQILVLAQDAEGGFTTQALAFDPLAPRPPDEERTTTALGDVNADGRVDLLLTQTPSRVGLFERFTSQLSLFLNPNWFDREVAGHAAPPASTVKVDGLAIAPALLDFDGDGDLDLLVTALDVDMKSRLMKSVGASYQLFRYDGEAKGFEREPFFRLSRPFPEEQLKRNSTAPVCFFSGDYDGDGRKDLLDIAESGAIVILAGTSDTGILSADRYAFKDEIFRAEAAVENDVLIADLNADGASDVAAFRGGVVYVVRSSR